MNLDDGAISRYTSAAASSSRFEKWKSGTRQKLKHRDKCGTCKIGTYVILFANTGRRCKLRVVLFEVPGNGSSNRQYLSTGF